MLFQKTQLKKLASQKKTIYFFVSSNLDLVVAQVGKYDFFINFILIPNDLKLIISLLIKSGILCLEGIIDSPH